MVKTGLERVFDEPSWRKRLEGKRVAWLANATTVDSQLRHGVDRSLAEGLRVERLFGPEHGVRGTAQDMAGVDHGIDPLTQLPCISLYGVDEESLKPKPADLVGVDVVLIDLQDIGTRYYTYAYTALWMIEACAAAGIEAWVLDRPNPIGGEVLEGNLVKEEFRSFVGAFPLPTRHGLTLGELATLFAKEEGWTDALTVVPMLGWTRDQFFDTTGLPWVMPSPNMPTLETALVYPGQCLLEGTNLSEGRGTTRPFELFGAPWLDACGLYEALVKLGLPGVAWRQVAFEPTFQKHSRQVCQGLQLHIFDRSSMRSLTTSLAILQQIWKLHPGDLRWRTEVYEFVQDRLAIDLLLGDVVLRMAIEDGADLKELDGWMASSRAPFESLRAAALLY